MAREYNIPGQTDFYQGKVRDVLFFAKLFILLKVTNRISAYDVNLGVEIRNKGEILNRIAAFFLEEAKKIVKVWLLENTATLSFGYYCEPFKIEMVVRRYLAGSMWKDYKNKGQRIFWGVRLPEGMKENDLLPQVMVTPSTKEDIGKHDEAITREEIIEKGLATEAEYNELERISLALFEQGTNIALLRGLILVDTKYEFGKRDGEIYLIDEVHTPDSSRYFYSEGYAEKQKNGEPQKHLSKEFVREWLKENGFEGKPGQKLPEISLAMQELISKRYKELFEVIMKKPFVPVSSTADKNVEKVTVSWLTKHGGTEVPAQ